MTSMFATRMVKYYIKNISGNILKRCSSNLAPEVFITTETKCHANGFDADPVLIKTEILNFQFILTKDHLLQPI